ncbi:hypothetical protein Rhal01_02995 [Rubritalea halochordaticola]|uniref:NAD(P)/FAD-dependent oxidoreductase n=1 Tax=Rubritalea halochordaticola TaxID=714537 RepID=A0ABP9V466_9BACT
MSEAISKPIEICGGGLSGLSLGIALRRRGVPVVLREAGSYPRHKVCGEFICGVSREVLDDLGISEALADAQVLSSSAWFRKGRLILERELPTPARGISRFSLDQRLAGQFEDLGGELIPGERCQLVRESGDGVVWAAGRPRNQGRRWLGLKMHCSDLELNADLEMHLGDGAYVGVSKIEGGRANVCGLFALRSGLSGKQILSQYLRAAGLDDLNERLQAAQSHEESFCAVAGFELGKSQRPPEMLCLGDAWAMIPPFTGNGMSMAFESAAEAVGLLESYALGKSSWSECLHQYNSNLGQRFDRRLSLAALLNPAMLGAVGQHAVSGIAKAKLLPFDWLFQRLRDV